MPNLKKAELIGGMVYMPSPISLEHGLNGSSITVFFWTYMLHTSGTESASDVTWKMLKDSPQPDAFLRVLPEYGGQSKQGELYPEGAPELAAEVALSSVAYDLHQKLDLYREAGVQEYLVVTLKKPEVRWLRLVARQLSAAGGRQRRHHPLGRFSRPVATRAGFPEGRHGPGAGDAATRAPIRRACRVCRPAPDAQKMTGTACQRDQRGPGRLVLLRLCGGRHHRGLERQCPCVGKRLLGWLAHRPEQSKLLAVICDDCGEILNPSVVQCLLGQERLQRIILAALGRQGQRRPSTAASTSPRLVALPPGPAEEIVR